MAELSTINAPSPDGSQTLGATLDAAAQVLATARFEEPRRQARRLLAAALDLPEADIFARPERILHAPQRARVGEMVSRMLAHEPLSRILGCREFWGLEFLLSADTLDPRPETETVVEAVLERLPGRQKPYRFLDLGTGTGCLLLALLSEYPQASGVGVDIALGAVRTARRNAERLGLGERAGFAVGAWADAIAGRFDAIVANPPYIATTAITALPPAVREWDPPAALDGGADGLASYRDLAVNVERLLPPGGVFAVEIGIGQGEAVAELLRGGGIGPEAFVCDLAGIERVVVARRAHDVAARRAG